MKIQSVLNTDNDTNIDDMTENVNDILISAAQSVLVRKRVSNAKKSVKKKKKWFDQSKKISNDQDCFKLRKEVVKLGRKLCKINSTHEQHVVFFRKKKDF